MSNPALFESGNFFPQIFRVLAVPVEIRNVKVDAFVVRNAVLASAFVTMIREPREIYFKHLKQFGLLVMRNVPLNNRRNKEAIKNIAKILSNIQESIDRYPAGHITLIEGLPIPESEQAFLITSHGALITQIRVIFNAL